LWVIRVDLASGASPLVSRFQTYQAVSHPVRISDVTEYWIGLARQSALMLAARITLAHFSVSSAISAPKAAGEPGSAVPPISAGLRLVRMDRSDRRAEDGCRQANRGTECRRPGAGCPQTPRHLYRRVLWPFPAEPLQTSPARSAKRSPLLLRRPTSS